MNKQVHQSINDDPIKGFSIPWEKSREMVWGEMSDKLDANEKKVIVLKRSNSWRYLAAAIFTLVIAGSLFLRFYEKDISSAFGEHESILLPDGSSVKLNAGSTLSYHPYWYRFNREIYFEGEGYFQVVKGKAFSVQSPQAVTRVLGTSFTIFSRGEAYRVICHTGFIEVTSEELGDQLLLEPNQRLVLNSEGRLLVERAKSIPDEAHWSDQIFEYTAVPLNDVLEEISRQYNVIIPYPLNLQWSYTGDFSSARDLETSLNLVCKPFQITFEKIQEGEYRIIQEAIQY